MQQSGIPKSGGLPHWLPHDKKVFAYQCVEDYQALPDSETDTNIVFNPVTPRQTDAHVDKNVAFNVCLTLLS